MQAISRVERINQLLDLARAVTGSDNRTSMRVGVSRMTLSDWRTDRKSCPFEKQAMLADIAGLRPMEVVAYAMLEGAKDAAEKERVFTAVGRNLRAINVAEYSTTYASDDLDSETDWPAVLYDVYLVRELNAISGSVN